MMKTKQILLLSTAAVLSMMPKKRVSIQFLRWRNVKRMAIIFKNVVLAYIITLVLFVLYSFVLTFTSVPESSIPLFTFVTGMISVFIGSSMAVIKIKEKGMVNGALVGLIYILILYLLSSIFSTGFGVNGYAFSMILFNVIIGMIGGIIGVNMCKEGK